MPPGKKGRPAGSRNKLPANRRLAAQQAGMTPLEFLLNIMKDDTNDMDLRFDAAKAAAPYCHARLAAVQVEHKQFDGDPNAISNAFLASIITGELDQETGSRNALPTPASKRKVN